MSAEHPIETKAAVLAALLAGQSIGSVAREYNIPKTTVSRWKNEDKPMDGTQKKEIGELLLEYLRANLSALIKQVDIFTDPDWLRAQTASDAAVLHGVMTDKAVRLLEALSKNAPDDTAKTA